LIPLCPRNSEFISQCIYISDSVYVYKYQYVRLSEYVPVSIFQDTVYVYFSQCTVFVIACSSIGQYLSVNLFMSGPMLTSTMLPMLSTQNLASADSRFRSGEQSLLDNYFSFKLPIKYFIKYIFSGFALLFGFDFFYMDSICFSN
jgi:hypothetical protein